MLVQPVRHRQCLAVIGDGEIMETRIASGDHHRFDIVAAVGFCRVRVQIALNVGERHQAGERVLLGGLDLAAAFAEFRRDLHKAERAVDVGLRVARDERAVLDPEQPVLVELEPARHRAIA